MIVRATVKEPSTVELLVHARSAPPLSRLQAFALVGVVGVLLLSGLLMLLLATGPIGSDDISYYRGATQLLQDGAIARVHHHHLGRKGFIFIAGVPAALGGHIMFGVLANIAYSHLLNTLVAIFAYRQFGPVASLVAAIVVSLNGVTLLWSGTLMPDTTVSLFVFGSVACLYLALLPSTDLLRSEMFVALAGIVAGLGYTIKEPAILAIAPGLLCILWLRQNLGLRQRLALSLAYGAAAGGLLFADGLLHFWLSGDFFYRSAGINAVHNVVGNPAVPLEQFVRMTYWSAASIFTRYSDFLLIPAFAALLVWPIHLFRRVPEGVFGATGLFLGAYLVFGTTSFPELRPMPFQPRYLSPLFPLLAVALGAMVSRSRSPVIAAGLLAAPLLAFIALALYGATSEAGSLSRASYFKSSAAVLQGELSRAGAGPIMVDASMREMLQHFMPREDVARLSPIPAGPLPQGSFLVDSCCGSLYFTATVAR